MTSALLPHWLLSIVSSQRGGAVCVLISVMLSASRKYQPNEGRRECVTRPDDCAHSLQMKSDVSKEGSRSFGKGFAFNDDVVKEGV